MRTGRRTVCHRDQPWFKRLGVTLMLGVVPVFILLWPAPARADDSNGLRVWPLNSWSAQLQWANTPGVARIQVLRDGRLLDDFPAPAGATLSYTDYGLWQSTSYGYVVRTLNASNELVNETEATTMTPAQTGAFPRLYDPMSFWNQPIPQGAGIDADSASMVSAALVAYGWTANLANSNDWGEPLSYANPVSRLNSVGCTWYDCSTPVSFRIPQSAVPATASDHHLTVIDPSTDSELDMWLTSYDAGTDSWSAGSRYVTASNGWGAGCSPGNHCNGAVAAGFAAFGGVVRPEEIAQGHIDHALFFGTPYTRADYIACPATNTDGVATDTAAIPLGGHIQLDPAFDVDGQAWPPWEKVIAHALQSYGAYLGDTAGSLSFAAEPNLDRGYDAWSLAGVPGAPLWLADLPWSSFRVLQLDPC